MDVPEGWREQLADEATQPYFQQLSEFLDKERAEHTIFPPADLVFNALRLTPFQATRVLLLGQDPYHDDGQAHGLCFSVPMGVKPPPSLVNIFKELKEDVNCPLARTGSLEAWAKQGVLLLNTVLTVRAHQPNSHQKKGWEQFTDAIIRKLNDRPTPVIFVLWGRPAQQKLKLIDDSRHVIIQSAHPSPLSAARGFFGSKPFSQINNSLEALGQTPIDWCLATEG